MKIFNSIKRYGYARDVVLCLHNFTPYFPADSEHRGHAKPLPFFNPGASYYIWLHVTGGYTGIRVPAALFSDDQVGPRYQTPFNHNSDTFEATRFSWVSSFVPLRNQIFNLFFFALPCIRLIINVMPTYRPCL